MYLSMCWCSVFSVRDLLKAEGAETCASLSCLLRSDMEELCLMEIPSSTGSMSSTSLGPSTFLGFLLNFSVVFLNYVILSIEPYGPFIVGELFNYSSFNMLSFISSIDCLKS